MHTGSCLCGRVEYQYEGEIHEISRCYCNQCQKAQGGAFVAVAPVFAAKFTLLRGQEYLKTFRASPAKTRVFCAECGSPLFSARDDLPEMMRLRLGSLDTQVSTTHQYHAYVSQKVDWYDIQDEYPRHLQKPDC